MAHLLTFLRDSLSAALARRRAAAVLASLSDRQLADLGLERFAIDAHVRDAWPQPDWPAAPDPAGRPVLQGCG